MIMDCSNLGVWSFPYKLTKSVMKVMRSQYKQKPRAVFIMNAPKTFYVIWTVLSSLLDENALAKV